MVMLLIGFGIVIVAVGFALRTWLDDEGEERLSHTLPDRDHV
ncbi:hypothetical protein QU487_02165 [Crenobacter sp. SG2305]|nr:hypothetical protein [Crenobacter sp. SG2305]MDN0081565.1 hypothetical protein [Crenobacter sp. SG2305]